MTAFVNGQPVADLTQANTWGEWVSMSNQLILDGIKESANIANVMIGSDIISALTSRADLGMDTGDSPNFANVTLNWADISGLTQNLGTNNSVEFNRVLVTGDLQITPGSNPGVNLYIHESNDQGIYVKVSDRIEIREATEILKDASGNYKVFISKFSAYMYGKFGVGTQTPNNNLEIVGSFNTSSTLEDSGARVYSDNNKVPKSAIGRGNIPNTTQVPRTGGTFSGSVEIQGTSNINELRVLNNPVRLGERLSSTVYRAVI